MDSVNIEDIMRQIRGESVSAAHDNTDAGSVDISENEFDKRYYDDSVAKLKRTHYVAWDRSVTGNPIARFIKKIVKKLTCFMIDPVVEDQNRYNIHNVDVLTQLGDYISQSQKTIDELQKEVNELKAQVADLKAGQN